MRIGKIVDIALTDYREHNTNRGCRGNDRIHVILGGTNAGVIRELAERACVTPDEYVAFSMDEWLHFKDYI